MCIPLQHVMNERGAKGERRKAKGLVYFLTAWIAIILPGVAAATDNESSDSLAELVGNSAAVVLVKVLDINYAAQDDATGIARTAVTAKRVEALKGDLSHEQFVFHLYGGSKRDGGWTRVSTNPDFAVGHTYVIFIRSTDYRYSPFMPGARAVLREVGEGPNAAFVDRDGHLITTDAEGQLRRGGRVADDERSLASD